MAVHETKEIGFTLNQLFKQKGGYLWHSTEGTWIKLEAKIGDETWSGTMGANMKGLRAIEREIADTLAEEPFRLEYTSASACGLDNSYYRRNYPGLTFRQQIAALETTIKEQAPMCDVDGFRLDEREPVIGTPYDYHKGVAMDAVEFENELALKRGLHWLKNVPGRIEGLRFYLEETEESEEITPLARLVEIWNRVPFFESELPVEEYRSVETVSKIVELPRESDCSQDTEMEQLFLKKLREPLTSRPEHERVKTYWGGGNPPISNRKTAVLVKTCFEPNREMKISEFMSIVKDRIINDWNLEEVAKEMGDFDIDLLVVGQMLKSKGQLRVNFKEKTVMYEPRPAAYLARQAELKL